MDLPTKQPFHSTFAITISFIVGAPLVTSALILASSMAGNSVGAAEHSAGWLGTCLTVAAYAGFAGILVDLMRFVTTLAWRKKIPFRLKLRKVLKDNLA